MGTDAQFLLRGDHIELAALLKASGLAGSGGEAKSLIVGGAVRVNGDVDARRARKLRAGNRVELGGACIRIVAAG